MKLRVLVAVLCAALLVVPAAFAEVSATMNIAGDVETNTNFTIEDDGSDNSMSWGNNGRTHIKFDGTIEGDNGWFAYGKGDAMIDVSSSVGVDDAYLELGTESFSILIGRYEAPGAFGKGQDTFIVEAPGAPGRYQADYLRGRNDFNNIALKFGSFELGVIVASDSVDYDADSYSITDTAGTSHDLVVTSSFGTNVYGVRPAFTMSSDAFTLNVAAEFATYMPQNTDNNDYAVSKMGGGANVEFAAGAGTVGASVAYGMITGDDMDGNEMDDDSTLSTFGYFTMPVGDNSFGLGGGYTMNSVDDNDDTMFETFASFNQQLPVEGLWLKYAASFASASFDAGDDTTGFGARVRFNYDF
ncbi:MAG: hypothetical protein GY801_16795 [bacterium]|nr:hypothetical protein [bacterium]